VRLVNKRKQGIVYLIGGGPGSADLLTLKAKECLQKADVVIYDYLVNESILCLAGEDAELIYVGKRGGMHTASQQRINSLLIEKAKRGLTVARLKGGDPFIFGRGGEEAMELSRARIPFEIVPGVTSAIAVPAYAGIPLTHRAYSSTVCFITGHEDPTKETSSIDWEALAGFSGTLVFLMGMRNLGTIAQQLMDNGRSPNCPAAVIANGTLPRQRAIRGTLSDIHQKVRAAKIAPPGIIVVGDVVGLREHLNWFESKPLFGKKIVVTRPEEQAQGLARMLSELGAWVQLFPTIKVIPPRSWGGIDKAITGLSRYDWVLFTSVNGVEFFFQRLSSAKKDARHLSGIQIGVIGPATGDALKQAGLIPDLLPEKYSAEGIVEALEELKIAGKRFLLPRPALARDFLPKKITSLGATVDVVEAYQTVLPEYDDDRLEGFVQEGPFDMITFTSPSTVDNLLHLLKGKLAEEGISAAKIACIGPITAQRAAEKGLDVTIVPDSYTIEGLFDAIVRYYNKD
jgi:uroporphyrinogen III methyltransferase/synthase